MQQRCCGKAAQMAGVQKDRADGAVRLNKYLSDAGYCSRREADLLIEAGRVFVDGERAVPGVKVEAGQSVTVGRDQIRREEELILLAFNKPAGIVCTTSRHKGETNIYDLLQYPKRVFSVGRLDRDSEGLLLMTNYGELANQITKSDNYHEKEYLVTVNRDIQPAFLKKMSRGVRLEELDVRTRPCKVELVGKRKFRITLTQGLNRQIRRMCEALGYKVIRLVRIRIMNIELGSLKPGEYRRVSRREIARLNDMLKNTAERKRNQNG